MPFFLASKIHDGICKRCGEWVPERFMIALQDPGGQPVMIMADEDTPYEVCKACAEPLVEEITKGKAK